jgi:tetratricopeptide (TPR) repeat protein
VSLELRAPERAVEKEVAVSTGRRRLMAVLVLAAFVVAPASRAAPTEKEKIAIWIEQLSDNDFQRREEATQRLWEVGQAAEPALRAAAGSSDAEVSRRARDILDRFKWGIYPDTPKAVVDLIRRYQDSDRSSSDEILRELFDNGSAGCKAVLRIYRAGEDLNTRRQILLRMTNHMARAVPALLAEGDLEPLAPLVEAVLEQDVRSGIGNYVAYWGLRGKLDERIALLQARLQMSPGDRRAWEVLAYLQRAKGDVAAARAAADKSSRADLVDALLVEAGAWKELASRPVGTETTLESERLGLRAAYRRLAGDTKGFEESVADLKKLGEATKDDEATAGLVAKALFLNDRPTDALEVLSKNGDRAMAFQVLVARMQLRDAFKLVAAERAVAGKQLPELEILAARTLWGLGEKEKARPVFAHYGDLIGEDADATWLGTLIEAELLAGLRDQALQHAGKVLSLAEEKGFDKQLLPKLFPDNGDEAQALWDFLRRREPGRPAVEILTRVADVIGHKSNARDLRPLIDGVQEALKTNAITAEVAEHLAVVLAEAALAAGETELAVSTLEKSNTSAAWLKLGDLQAAKQHWDAAAERYRRSREADRHKPLAMFLWGRSLALAGHEAEGRQRMDQSHWLALGNEEVRNEFAAALTRRGLAEASRYEYTLLAQISPPASYYAGEAERHRAVEARTRQDYLRSAEGQERALLRCLRTYVSFVEPAAYVGVPALVHRQRAQGLLAAGKTDEALREASLCLEILPGEVDIPIALLPGLTKAGRVKDANVLFERTQATLDAVTRDYPKCGWAANSIAWLCACCRRDLDGGLARARKAVELDPQVAGFFDTLSEVHFQRGEKDQAIAAQKKAIELDPKKPYYRKQLKRMEAGDPNAPRPVEDEDDAG